jgi:hypothetical protein
VTDIAATGLQARDGILARTNWQPAGVQRTGRQTLVIRSGAELARLMRVTGDEAERSATELMARRLGVQTIDWNKQMLLSVSAGLKTNEADQLSVTRVQVKEKDLVVSFRLLAPTGGATGFGFPAETVLVDRFEGNVRFDEEKPASDDKPLSR